MKTIYEKYNIDITNNIVIGLLFMMTMSSNFAFGQTPPWNDNRSRYLPARDYAKNAKQGVALISNNDASSHANEYLYFRSGEEDDDEWFYDAQFMVADDWVATRRPLRFYGKNGEWSESGESIMNTLHGSAFRGKYGLSFIAGHREVMTLRRGYNNNVSLHLGGTHTGWSRIGANGTIAFWANGMANENDSPQLSLDKYGNLYLGEHLNASSITPSLKKQFDVFVRKGLLTEDLVIGKAEYWADYVFDKDYKLKPLSEVEQFIKKNKHLPNIPSKEVVSKDGYSMYNMNVLFLEKIEELTLYIIQQEKLINKLSDRLDSLTDTSNSNSKCINN